ncbi:tRNA (adenosine(37)-N6)-dimethylallyltransferase MiaA [Bryocella elongata]|uniref:tRNA (adenosine(37)-N6)-dimethylallyltransferase MiaA n=1 Tax=Bryocella elongata TaxID=863522 RepID=UPI001F01E2DB|nr:tRNA (adenosine(37)-N6)-dimethylallyltransferase MiaA [Bryocella elongata]
MSLTASIPAPLIVLAGPTASGKTSLAIHLAEQLNGEILSCDSVSVYRGLDIGSAKPSLEERTRIPHYGLDWYAPNEEATAGDYARRGRIALADITSRGKLPIVAGGTGLYLRALIEGLAPAPQRDEALRDRLRAREEKRPGSLHRLLTRFDARAAAAIHANDIPKVIRALEMTLLAQAPQTTQWAAGKEALEGYSVLRLGLDPPRALLYERINARAAAMFERGLVEETAAIRAEYGEALRSMGALGYAQASALLRGEITREEAIRAAQQGHRNYAKRQLTWFRREPDMRWLQGFGDAANIQHEALETTLDFLSAANGPYIQSLQEDDKA